MDSPRRSTWFLLAGVLAIAVAVFAPALGGGLVYDDEPLIARNPDLHSLGGALGATLRPYWGPDLGYWRPLTGLAIAVGHQLGGATGIHVFALLLHLTATWAAFRLARRLTQGDDARALLVALLFALHPVQVESVAWAAAINDPLWGLCALLCLDAVVHWRQRGSTGPPLAAWLAFALALASKENALAALPMVVLVDLALRRRFPAPAPGAALRLYGGLALVLAAYVGARMLVFGEWTAGFGRAPTDLGYAGARLVTAPLELAGRFVELLVVPWSLTPFRPLDPMADTSQLARAALWVTAAAAVALVVWRRRAAVGLTALAIIALPLVPTVVRFRAVGAYPVADRYLYVAAFGWALLITWKASARLARVVLLAVAAAYGLLSFQQTWVWHDPGSLAEHGLSHAPEDPNLHAMWGNVALRSFERTRDPAELQHAQRAFDEALRLASAVSDETRGVAHRARADALLGLGWCELLVQQARPRPDSSIPARTFERALEADVERPQAWIGLGICHGMAGSVSDAERCFEEALALAPHSPEAHFNLGLLFAKTEQPERAREHLEQALRSDPANTAARQLLETL